LAGKLVEEVLEAQKDDRRRIVRLIVEVTPRSFESGNFNENVELVDWQFLNADRSGWTDWAKKPRPRPVQVTTPARTTPTKERSNASQQNSLAKAVKYNQELADIGDAYGQLRMGERYLVGDGVEKDEVKAREYFAKAAAQGNETAAKALEKLAQKP
jgi:TPR repeat protein